MPFFSAKPAKQGRKVKVDRAEFYRLLDTGQYTRAELADKLECSIYLIDRMMMDRRKAAKK